MSENIESLYDFFLRNNPEGCSEVERDAINAFANLLTDSNWRPSNPYWGGFMAAIQIGALAATLRSTSGAEKRIARAVRAIERGTSWDPTEVNELHVAALLTTLGCKVRLLQPSKTRGVRMPDLQIENDEIYTIDVEVVSAEEKAGHTGHKRILQALTAAIGLKEDTHYAVFIAEPLSQDAIDAVLAAIIEVTPGMSIDAPNKWRVTAGAIEDRERFVSRRDLEPSWWGAGPTFCNIVSRIGGSSSPVTSIVTMVPLESYLNPIKRKADRPQRVRTENPYLIALDASSLPGASERLGDELKPDLQLWPHVSAILIEYPFFSIGSCSWRCSLIRNPHAQRALPPTSLDSLHEKQQSISVSCLAGGT